ncbi:MAG: hypothetical protein Q8L34_02355 [Candidatus Woesearchaeota archaeon]|nr:hypothetical protein [Candidatus Woesearchaeota archaeon]
MKVILILLVSLLAVMQIAHAEEVITLEPLNQVYSAGETVQVKITTLPLEKPLKAEQISLYEGATKIPIAPFFIRYSSTVYVLYFDMPSASTQDLILKVERALYKKNGILEETTAQRIITLDNEKASILAFIPGFVVLEKNQEGIQLQVENKKGSTFLNITTSPSITHVYNGLQTVNTGTKRIFRFTVDQTKLESDAHITLNHNDFSYTIPVMQRQEIVQQQPQPSQTPAALTFIATKSEVKQIIQPGIVLAGTLSLKNQGNTSLDNISLALVGNIRAITTIDTTFIPSLQPQQSVDITLTINKNRDAVPSLYEGVLQAATGTETASFPLSIEVQEETSGGEINATEVNLDLKQNELPDDLEQNPLNINLSKPTPQQAQKEYPIGLIIVTLFILGILIAFYVLKKKKPIKEETFDEYIKKIRK